MSTRAGCAASNRAICRVAQQRARDVVEAVHERLLRVRLEGERDAQAVGMGDRQLLEVDGQLVAPADGLPQLGEAAG